MTQAATRGSTGDRMEIGVAEALEILRAAATLALGGADYRETVGDTGMVRQDGLTVTWRVGAYGQVTLSWDGPRAKILDDLTLGQAVLHIQRGLGGAR